MLEENPKALATVILERLRPLGYASGITVLKERLVQLCPVMVAAKSYQGTSYLPGEIAQLDWWHTGYAVPVGRDVRREAFALMATLPHSATHATYFTSSRSTPDSARRRVSR
jgi:hypothetical protein